jgi:hypothetical protein
MSDLSDFSSGGGGKFLILPPVQGVSHSTYGGASDFLTEWNDRLIPLALPKITNAARDFSSTGNFSFGSATRGRIKVYEMDVRNFTINAAHQMTVRPNTINVIRAAETITIGGNGITSANDAGAASSDTNIGGVFLGYPYNHAQRTNAGVTPTQNSNGGPTAASAASGEAQMDSNSPSGGAADAGACGGYTTNAAGGLAGNTIRSAVILIAKNIVINGNITLNGTAATVSANGGHGGGHGGYLYCIANSITYTGGTINVSGGAGANGGGGNSGSGGGGHCGLFLAAAKTFTGSGTTITANVGAAGAKTGTGINGTAGGFPYPLLATGYLQYIGDPFS